METSSEIKNIAKALGIFQGNVEKVTKDSVNPFFKSKYASFENVIETVKPALEHAKLAFAQFPDGDGLTTIVMHESGEWIKATAKLIIKDQTPQGLGSAITYMRRYALSAALGLATEDDDDGNGPAKAPERPLVASQTKAKPKEEEVRIKAAKDRIKTLVDKITEGELVPTGRDELKKWYGDMVFEHTGLSLPLAGTLKDYEDIAEALAEVEI